MDPVEWIVDGTTWRAVTAHCLLVEVVAVQILQMIEGKQNFLTRIPSRLVHVCNVFTHFCDL